MYPLDLLWLLLLLIGLQPTIQQQILAGRRTHAIHAMERQRGSRTITLIHRRETFTFLGIPFGGFIDIDDSEAVLRAIEMTGKQVPIDFVLHTPGGLVLAAEQIASALADHPAPVTVHVPHYALSGGTLIALAADQIVMSPSAVLGPLDPQLGEYPSASILSAVAQKETNKLDDKTLILADVSRKAQTQVREFVAELLRRQMSDAQAVELARMLTDGRWTHDYPIDVKHGQALGMKISTELPDPARVLMRLYPQPRGRRPSVEYIPVPYGAPPEPERRRHGPGRAR